MPPAGRRLAAAARALALVTAACAALILPGLALPGLALPGLALPRLALLLKAEILLHRLLAFLDLLWVLLRFLFGLVPQLVETTHCALHPGWPAGQVHSQTLPHLTRWGKGGLSLDCVQATEEEQIRNLLKSPQGDLRFL